MYPRRGCALFDKKLVQALRIKPDHHFFSNDDRGRGTTAIFINQVLDSLLVAAHIAILIRYASLREVGRSCMARWSARLSKDDNGSAHVDVRCTTRGEGNYFS